VHWVAGGAIRITAIFNYRGGAQRSIVQNLTTIAKYGGLLFIIVLALAIGLPRTGRANFTPAGPPGSFAGRRPFGLALVSALWAVRRLGRPELRGPARSRTRAARCRGADHRHAGVIAIYLLANVAYLAVMSVEEIRNSRLVAADVAERLIGAPGVIFVAVTVMLSTFGTLNGTLLTGPRIFFAMADDGLFFKPWRRCTRPTRARTWPS
jgi:amino acid transporter